VSLRRRVERLERATAEEQAGTLWLVFLDPQGIVLDSGKEDVRPWVGRHYRDVKEACVPIGKVWLMPSGVAVRDIFPPIGSTGA
jgi:hypothetical protein